jgi:thymidine phosphorylase
MSFFPQELIRRKRDGHELSAEEIDFIVKGIADGSFGDGHVAAFAMAVFFRDMTREECARLTIAMARSGRVMDWRKEGIEEPIVDKHSSGGVGDKVSLMLAPIVAACGGYVPMIAGRGLGHTGGTIDKLESIPGYDIAADVAKLRGALKNAGAAIVGATADIAPADRRLYAIRDATGSVENVSLITASILSKKLAAGLEALVMDVKVGNGAFAATDDFADRLAESIVRVARQAGLRTSALITDMDFVLGRNAGNAVEVMEAIRYLKGEEREDRLHEVTRELSAELLVLGKIAGDIAAARDAVDRALSSGAAAERFARMVGALGGPKDLLEHPERHLAAAPVTLAVVPKQRGFVAACDTRSVGLILMELGGGRRDVTDKINHAVGLTEVRAPGEPVGPDRPLALVHARNQADGERATAGLLKAFTVAEGPSPSLPVVRRRL